MLGQGSGKGEYNSSYTDTYKGEGGGEYQKVTRHDLINKNYIFPQDKYAHMSSYTEEYYKK